ncbi:MAG: hypothetical protein PHP93_03150, partial [Kiritimatiellales bacterium]|nr:hypothetical protein [Kiritimatiellales bacterium]
TNTTLQSPAGRFYVAGLNYVVDGVDADASAWPMDAVYKKNLLHLVRKESLALYPRLFTNDQTAGSVPLWVEVEDSITSKDGKTLAWMLCTLTLVGTVFPVPMEIDRDMDVSVSPWNGRDGRGSEPVQVNFKREQHMWGSILSPLGLISIPGESDFPKVSEAFNMSRFAYDDAPQVAQQVATAVAKMVITKDSAYWTAPSRWTGSPASPGIIPATALEALPLPTQTVAPF